MYAKAELIFKDYGLGTNVEENRGKFSASQPPNPTWRVKFGLK